MKTKNFYSMLFIAAIASVLAACNKTGSVKTDAVTTAATTVTTTTAIVKSTGSIAIGTTASLVATYATNTKDSIYVTNCYPPKDKKDSVAFSSLSATITTYLTANYSGYTAVKAYAITDSTKTVINYIVVIKYNSNLVGLKFTAAGVFVAVLEQRAGADLANSAGCHQGGPFDDRGGFHIDTVAISAIPTVVKTYFTTTYPTDTLLHAGIAPNGDYILISKNKLLYATDITVAGALVKRIQLDAKAYIHAAVIAANLPAAVTTYLTTTYPGYVFDKAFSASNASGIQYYFVLITSNSTKYAVQFTAAGVFVKVTVVR